MGNKEADFKPVHVYVHLVNKGTKDDPTWEPMYFAEKERANILPQEKDCLHQEPSMVAAKHNITDGRYVSLRTGEEIVVH